MALLQFIGKSRMECPVVSPRREKSQGLRWGGEPAGGPAIAFGNKRGDHPLRHQVIDDGGVWRPQFRGQARGWP